jgi:HK97 gp10 family phage protein
MADLVEVRTNLPDFLARMREFSYDITKNIVRSGLRQAALVYRKRAEELAPTGPPRKRHVVGTLKRNIIAVRARKQQAGSEHWFVLPKEGSAKKTKGPQAFMFLPFYWRWVEAGHRKVPRGIGLTGGRRTVALKRARFDAAGGGMTKAAWFLRNSSQQVGGAALQAFVDQLQKRIDKENAK